MNWPRVSFGVALTLATAFAVLEVAGEQLHLQQPSESESAVREVTGLDLPYFYAVQDFLRYFQSLDERYPHLLNDALDDYGVQSQGVRNVVLAEATRLELLRREVQRSNQQARAEFKGRGEITKYYEWRRRSDTQMATEVGKSFGRVLSRVEKEGGDALNFERLVVAKQSAALTLFHDAPTDVFLALERAFRAGFETVR